MRTIVDNFAQFQRMRSLSEATIRRRRTSLEGLARWVAPTELVAATQPDIEAWLGSLPTARTRDAYRTDVRVFYEWAHDRELVDKDPTRRLARIKTPKAIPRPLPVDVAELAVTTGGPRVRRMAMLGLFAGLRAGEIAALHTDDIDLDHGVLVVRHGKGGKDRVVPLHPRLAAVLERVPAGYVVGWDGRRVGAGTVSSTLGRHLRRCGIDAATGHQLRHTFGTELARRTGGDLVAIGKLMGHGSTETTKGYVGWSADMGPVVASMFGDVS